MLYRRGSDTRLYPHPARTFAPLDLNPDPDTAALTLKVQATALLKAGLQAREAQQLESAHAVQRAASDDAEMARASIEERVEVVKKEHSMQIAAMERLHAEEIDRLRELHRAAAAARESEFESQVWEVPLLDTVSVRSETLPSRYALRPSLPPSYDQHLVAPQVNDAAALHKAQLLAYHRIEKQGGTLHGLISEVSASVSHRSEKKKTKVIE